jgi:hypothetical protein
MVILVRHAKSADDVDDWMLALVTLLFLSYLKSLNKYNLVGDILFIGLMLI